MSMDSISSKTLWLFFQYFGDEQEEPYSVNLSHNAMDLSGVNQTSQLMVVVNLPRYGKKVYLLPDPEDEEGLQLYMTHDRGATVVCDISAEKLPQLLSHADKERLSQALRNWQNSPLLKEDSVCLSPTSMDQVYMDDIRGEIFYASRSEMMTVRRKSYSKEVVKRGKKLMLNDAYIGKRAGLILCFATNDDDSTVEIPFDHLSKFIEDGNELQRKLIQKPSTSILTDEFYDEDDRFGSWA